MSKRLKKLAFSLLPLFTFIATPLIVASCVQTKTEQDQINEEVKKVRVTVDGIDQKTPSEITDDDLKISNYNSEKYVPEIVKKTIDGNKLIVTLKLKSKDGKVASVDYTVTLEGFKKSEASDLQEIIDRLDVSLASDIDKAATKPSEVTADKVLVKDPKDKLLGIDIEKELNADDEEGKLEVKITLIRGKKTVSKTFTINDFKKTPASDIDKAAKKVTFSYENADKLDAADITDLDKVAPSQLDASYSIAEKSFVNSTATKAEINGGYREIKFKLKKDSETSKEFTFKLKVRKSDKDVIVDQRESIKSAFTLVNSDKAKKALEAINGSTLYFDFKTNTIYDKPYNDSTRVAVFKLKDGKTLANSTTLLEKVIENVSDWKTSSNKVTLVKKEGKYSLKFSLGKYAFKDPDKLFDYKEIETEAMSFSFISKETLDAKVDEIKDKFDYENKTNTLAQDATEDKIKKPDIPAGMQLTISNFRKDATTNSISFDYTLSSTDESGSQIVSKQGTAQITGFKEDELGKEFQGVTAEYENASDIEASQSDANNVKLKKNGNDWSVENGTITKEIIHKYDELGKIVVKVTLKKDEKSVSKEFTIDGFKKKETNLKTIIDRLKVDTKLGIDKSTKKASEITGDDLDVSDPNNALGDIEVKKELTPKDAEGKLEVKITLTKDGKTESKTFELSGFKIGKSEEDMIKELREAAKKGELFKTLPEDMIKKIQEVWTKSSKKGKEPESLYLKNGTFQFGKNSNDAKHGPIVFEFKDNKFNTDEYRELIKKYMLFPKKERNRKALKIEKNDQGKFIVKLKIFTATSGEKYQEELVDDNLTSTWALN
ncbi:phase variable surface lipoprotein P78 precursor [Metamycoplasma arthritidis]|uniref:Hypothetical lipoprotein n=1 Tax=Metamycoplasma arthritidis (strain 158L3-1) TaxID=243272 RepID=B3PNJ0_META1|nr:lipoprotein 17-related variable surface protein [Metamycoplasma arthritidis]ACF07592.1 hypothetical lipoprotein [Metamycoplasma arthritidis 158L3-1]VEU79100.1 phase variable surface lipoprotein P78 precursor [Metamycoplasma arthritidis]